MFPVTIDFMMIRRRLKSALLKQIWRRLQSQLLISRNYFKFYVVEENAVIGFWFGFQKFITIVAEIVECPTYFFTFPFRFWLSLSWRYCFCIGDVEYFWLQCFYIDIMQISWFTIYCQYIVKMFTIINIQYLVLLYNKFYNIVQ